MDNIRILGVPGAPISPLLSPVHSRQPTAVHSPPPESVVLLVPDSVAPISSPSIPNKSNEPDEVQVQVQRSYRPTTRSMGERQANKSAMTGAETLRDYPDVRQPSPNPLYLFAMLSNDNSPEPFEPRTYEQAISNAYAKMEWELAMGEDYTSLMENGTWEVVHLPPGCKSLKGKWVFKLKRGPNGEVLRYKARWCARGFEQRLGIDYHEKFASVVKPMSYKALFAIAAALGWEIEQMDVKMAFLYGDVKEAVYFDQPTSQEDGSGRVCRLKKAFYGLKQSPRVWYKTLEAFLESLGFRPLDADWSVFSNGSIIVPCYVDDLLMIGSRIGAIKQVKKALSQRFRLTDLGLCSFYLGMTVTRDRQNRTIKLSQQSYLEKILEDFDMTGCKLVATPMEFTKPEAAPETYEASKEQEHWYQSAVGSLMYAMLGTRPDIAYAVSVVSRYASNPTEAHKKMVKRIFRYLRGTTSLNLVYKGDLDALIGYTDAD